MDAFRNLKPNDIFTLDSKSYIVERIGRSSGGLMSVNCTEETTGQGWRIRRQPSCPIVITGTKPLVRAKLTKGEMMIWKGNKGEALLFIHQATDSRGRITAINPIDGKQWTLSGNGASYASFDDVMNNGLKM